MTSDPTGHAVRRELRNRILEEMTIKQAVFAELDRVCNRRR